MRDVYQRQLAQKLRNENKTFNEIGRIMNVSRHVARKLCVYKRIAHPKKRGRKCLLQQSNKLQIKRRISILKSDGQRVHSSKIINECHLNVSPRTIRRHLASIGMRYANAKRKIFLTKTHKAKRVEMALRWISTDHDWSKTIFSDEKRFTLDGPDNWMSYIGEKEQSIRQMRIAKGGGFMVWLMVMPNGLLSHKVIDGIFSSKDYIQLLKTSAVPISKLNYGKDFVFQEDNSSVHKAKVVKDFMKRSEINILEWPPKSPDLNIVEDIWKLLSSDVYDGFQFKKTVDLKKKINEVILEFNTTKREKIQALYLTIKQRLCTVLLKHGNLCN